MTGLGEAWLGEVRRGEEGHGKAWLGLAGHGVVGVFTPYFKYGKAGPATHHKRTMEVEVRGFRRIYCKLVRWDVFEEKEGVKILLISLASPEERIITQSALSDEEALRRLRDALCQLLAESREDVMFG